MALIHEERRDGRLYQVRSAGTSVRLYTNGVLHSQYSPSPRAATSIWDLLSMSALLAGGGRPDRVLVLGVGGGGVLRTLDQRFDAPRIPGVELDPVHLALARRYFALSQENFDLVNANARDWLAGDADNCFDLVIDDLFGDHDGVPRRAIEADGPWLDTLARRVGPRGALAVNFADPGEFRRSALNRSAHASRLFASGFTMRLSVLENVVAVLTREPVGMGEFSSRIGTSFGRAAASRVSLKAMGMKRGRRSDR